MLHRHDTLQDTVVMVTRATDQSQRLNQLVKDFGAIPLSLPLIKVSLRDNEDIRKAVTRLGEYDALIATSGNSLRALGHVADRLGVSLAQADQVCYAVGGSTARMAKALGMDCIIPPKGESGLDLGMYLQQAFANIGRAVRFLYPVGQLSGIEAARVLREAGHEVDMVTCYDTAPADPDLQSWEQARQSGKVVILPLYSPSAVGAYVKHYYRRDMTFNTHVVHACIGQTTAKAAAAAGLHVHCVADTPSDENLLEAAGEYIHRRAGM